MARDWNALDLESYLYLTANGLDTADHPAAAAYEDLYQMCKKADPEFEEQLRQEIEALRAWGQMEMAGQLETKLEEWLTERR